MPQWNFHLPTILMCARTCARKINRKSKMNDKEIEMKVNSDKITEKSEHEKALEYIKAVVEMSKTKSFIKEGKLDNE